MNSHSQGVGLGRVVRTVDGCMVSAVGGRMLSVRRSFQNERDGRTEASEAVVRDDERVCA